MGLGAGGVGREEVGAVNKRASDTGQEDEVPGSERGQASQGAYMSTYILRAIGRGVESQEGCKEGEPCP